MRYMLGSCITLALASCGSGHNSAGQSQNSVGKKLEDKVLLAEPMPFAEGLDKMRAGDRIAGEKNFRIYKDSKIYSRSIVDPALKAQQGNGFYWPAQWDRNIAYEIAGVPYNPDSGLRDRAKLLHVPLAEGDNGLNDGQNVRITLFFGVNKKLKPYAILVTIRQGNSFWSKHIERDGVKDWHPLGTASREMGPIYGKIENAIGRDMDDIPQIVSPLFCLAEKCQ